MVSGLWFDEEVLAFFKQINCEKNNSTNQAKTKDNNQHDFKIKKKTKKHMKTTQKTHRKCSKKQIKY